MSTLAVIDEHRVRVRAPLARTWEAVTNLARRLTGRPAPRVIAALWKLEPVTGFALASSVAPERIALAGHHRFARYELVFELQPWGDGVEVRARTSSEFPGVMGRVYNALVIGTGAHAFIVGMMLRQLREAAEK